MQLKIILIIFSLVAFGCSDFYPKQSQQDDNTPSINAVTVDSIKEKTVTTKRSVLPDFQGFAIEVLGENLRKHDFKYVIENYSLFDLIPIDGLDSVIAYSNKDYPKNSNPTYYNHFTFFCYKYTNSNQAKLNFDSYYLTSHLNMDDTVGVDQSYIKKANKIKGLSKYGGLIVQEDNWIFHLVETCGNTPIGGSWTDYEDLFIRFITNNRNEPIAVLNADCGKMKFIKEKRTTHYKELR